MHERYDPAQNGALNNYIADSAAFSLFDGTDAVNLNYTGTDVVNTLTVALAGQAAGVYGSATSGAPNVLPEFVGTGTITVLTGTAVQTFHTRDTSPRSVLPR